MPLFSARVDGMTWRAVTLRDHELSAVQLTSIASANALKHRGKQPGASSAACTIASSNTRNTHRQCSNSTRVDHEPRLPCPAGTRPQPRGRRRRARGSASGTARASRTAHRGCCARSRPGSSCCCLCAGREGGRWCERLRAALADLHRMVMVLHGWGIPVIFTILPEQW
jgi:hypothetical protein